MSPISPFQPVFPSPLFPVVLARAASTTQPRAGRVPRRLLMLCTLGLFVGCCAAIPIAGISLLLSSADAYRAAYALITARTASAERRLGPI